MTDTNVDHLRAMSPDECYDRLENDPKKSLPEDIGGHNMLRGDARVRIYRELIPFDPQAIADIGCGIGLTTAACKRAFPTAHVFGCDASESAIAYAKKTDTLDINYQALTIGAELKLPTPFDVMIFQEFYPFTRTSDFALHREFLDFIRTNLRSGGVALIQLAIRHPEITILANLPALKAYCHENGLALTQHIIPYDRLIDMTGSYWLSSLLTPVLSFIKKADKRIVLMLTRKTG